MVYFIKHSSYTTHSPLRPDDLRDAEVAWLGERLLVLVTSCSNSTSTGLWMVKS